MIETDWAFKSNDVNHTYEKYKLNVHMNGIKMIYLIEYRFFFLIKLNSTNKYAVLFFQGFSWLIVIICQGSSQDQLIVVAGGNKQRTSSTHQEKHCLCLYKKYITLFDISFMVHLVWYILCVWNFLCFKKLKQPCFVFSIKKQNKIKTLMAFI